MWMHQNSTIDYSVLKPVLGAAPIIIHIIAILVGFSIGRTGGVDQVHGRYVAGLIMGGLAAGANLGLAYILVQDDVVKIIMEVGAIYSVTGLLGLAGYFFSGIALAWFHMGIVSRPALVTGLAKGVGLYQLWRIMRAAVIKIVWLRTRNIGRPSELMTYASMLSLIDIPLSVIYLYFLYRAGARIEMKEKYLDAVYSLLVLDVTGAVIVTLVSHIGYDLNLLDILLTVASRIMASGLGVFGARFALISYGYFRARPEPIKMAVEASASLTLLHLHHQPFSAHQPGLSEPCPLQQPHDLAVGEGSQGSRVGHPLG